MQSLLAPDFMMEIIQSIFQFLCQVLRRGPVPGVLLSPHIDERGNKQCVHRKLKRYRTKQQLLTSYEAASINLFCRLTKGEIFDVKVIFDAAVSTTATDCFLTWHQMNWSRFCWLVKLVSLLFGFRKTNKLNKLERDLVSPLGCVSVWLRLRLTFKLIWTLKPGWAGFYYVSVF